MWKSIINVVLLGCLNNVWAGPFDPIVSVAWVGETIPGQASATLS